MATSRTSINEAQRLLDEMPEDRESQVQHLAAALDKVFQDGVECEQTMARLESMGRLAKSLQQP